MNTDMCVVVVNAGPVFLGNLQPGTLQHGPLQYGPLLINNMNPPGRSIRRCNGIICINLHPSPIAFGTP